MTLRMPSSSRAVAISEPVVHCGESRPAASLLTFFAIAFAWSWTGCLLAPALKGDSPVAATALWLMVVVIGVFARPWAHGSRQPPLEGHSPLGDR